MVQRPLFIQWHARSETGVAIIDEQHRGVVSIINTFYHLLGQGDGNSALYASIGETMKTYARLHFLTEEKLLETSAYPHFEEHKEMHRKLIQETERVQWNAVKENEAKLLLDFQKKWWLEHINEQDQHYVQHLRASGNIAQKK